MISLVSVGFLIASGAGASAKTCAAFLVAPDTVATSGHCLPPTMRSPGAACPGVTVQFPATGGQLPAGGSCAQVLSVVAPASVSDDGATQDYAFLKLAAPVSRPALKIAKGAVSDADALVTAIPSTTAFQTQSCRAVIGSTVVPLANLAVAPLGTVADCGVSALTPGAPILNSSGDAVAIAQGDVDLSDPALVQKYKLVPRFDSGVTDLHFATNLSCVVTPLDDPSTDLPGECQYPLVAKSRADAETAKKVDAIVQGFVQSSGILNSDEGIRGVPGAKWVAAHVPESHYVGSDPRPNIYTALYVVVPSCYTNRDAWTESHWIPVLGYDETTEVRVELPVVRMRYGINRYYQLAFQMESANDSMGLGLSFQPKTLHDTGTSPLTVLDHSFGIDSGAMYSYPLAACDHQPVF